MALTIVQAGMGGTGSTTASSTGTGAAVLATQPSFPSTIGVGGATASTSGAGITFPATVSASSDANTLDDYEEGTWTPSYSASNGVPFSSVTYENQAGFYTKIGNIVFVQGRLRTSNLTIGSASGELYVNNLPFTCVNDSNAGRNAGSLFAVNGFSGNNPSAINAESGNVYCQLGYRTTANGAISAMQVSMLQAASGQYNSMFFSIAYRVA